MTGSSALIANAADVERIERTPLAEQYRADSTYDMLRQAATRFPERDALVFVPKGSADEPPFVYSHAELLRRVTQAANLFHRLGVGPRDVVAYVLPNLPQAHFSLLGRPGRGHRLRHQPDAGAGAPGADPAGGRGPRAGDLGPGPGGELWDKMAAVVEQVPTLETVLQVSLAQYLVPGFVPPVASGTSATSTATHAGRAVLDFDARVRARTRRSPGERPSDPSRRGRELLPHRRHHGHAEDRAAHARERGVPVLGRERVRRPRTGLRVPLRAAAVPRQRRDRHRTRHVLQRGHGAARGHPGLSHPGPARGLLAADRAPSRQLLQRACRPSTPRCSRCRSRVPT